MPEQWVQDDKKYLERRNGRQIIAAASLRQRSGLRRSAEGLGGFGLKHDVRLAHVS